MTNFVFPEELNFFVESIRPFQIREVGSEKWLDTHEMIIKLSQQAALEAAAHREEEVKEMLISRDKLKFLIHEAYCIFLWKTKILPHLLDIDPNPQATFLIYTVLFHEGAVITLLDLALYHSSGCEALQNSVLDLIDYCAQGVTQLIGLVSMGHHENDSTVDVDEAILSELERQKRDLIYKIGLRCISILYFLSDSLNALPLSAGRRMIVTHDIIWLMADLLHFRPWQRRSKNGTEKFIDEKWMLVQGEELGKVVKHEAQTWFCLRQLLFNRGFMESYEFNDERRKHLSKTLGLMYEPLLDQLPPLIELKQYLCQLTVSNAQPNGMGNSKKTTLVLEEVPEIKDNLIRETEKFGGFLAIAQLQGELFLSSDKDYILNLAQRLNVAYNTDLLAELEEKVTKADMGKSLEEKPKAKHLCENCSNIAEKKCSKCKTIYYCSRECQLDDWPNHKSACT